MNSFRYCRDGLFLMACTLYAVNRWLIAPHVSSDFLRGQFDDSLLIPCALPVLLQLQRWFKLRYHDAPPAWSEITLYVALWSVLFEVIGPHLFRHTVGDPWDVVAYVIGGAIAGIWWNRHQFFRLSAANEL